MQFSAPFARWVDPRLLIGVAFLSFQLWILLFPKQPLFERPAHLIFALALLFLWRPLQLQKVPVWLCRSIDGLLMLAVVAVGAYYLIAFGRLATRMENVSPVLAEDMIFGSILVLLLLEGARRAVGWILVSVLLIFLGYGFAGPFIPGWLRFGGFQFDDAVEVMTMTTAGVLGVTTSTSVHFVFYFIVFGAVYAAIGGGQLFIDLALRLAGRATGGAAKAAIVASSLMGTISGSAVANVVSTGVFTIPLMRRTGLSGERAAAIEAIASTGGQLMPPIMGVAAFVMAELLNVPYSRIALAGLLPALAFYAALLIIVDLTARRQGLGTLTDLEMKAVEPLLPRLHLLLPPLVLIGFLAAGYSASYAAVMATASCPVSAFLRRSTFLNIGQALEAVRQATRQAAEVAVPIAAIGIIIAVAIQSNLALKFANALLSVGGGTLVGALLLTIAGCIIMGMGLPTVAAYIIGAILYAPALQRLGIDKLAAHFFIFYYCVLSMVTPPVALASFAAAGVAGVSAMRTSLLAFSFSLVAFFIPFGFIFDQAILFEGSLLHIAAVSAGLLASTALWAIALGGYLARPLKWAERLGLGVLGLTAVLTPTGTLPWAVAIGAGLAGCAFIWRMTGPGQRGPMAGAARPAE